MMQFGLFILVLLFALYFRVLFLDASFLMRRYKLSHTRLVEVPSMRIPNRFGSSANWFKAIFLTCQLLGLGMLVF